MKTCPRKDSALGEEEIGVNDHAYYQLSFFKNHQGLSHRGQGAFKNKVIAVLHTMSLALSPAGITVMTTFPGTL